MRNLIKRLGVALAILLAFGISVTGQQGQRGQQGQQGQRGRGGAPAPPDNRPFDPHDLSGVWDRSGGDRGVNAERTADVPSFTPEGQKRFDANKPARGRLVGQPLNGEHPGRVRARVPALSNDPILWCNPQGIPRLILDPEPVEFFHLDSGGKRLFQFFQWGRIIRQIWLDGRSLPSAEQLDLLGPSWMGISVGRWEGDTLAIDSVGHDDRTWLDMYGFPHSDKMVIRETYKRVSYDVIEWNFTITDPVIYTAPFVSDKKTFTRLKPEELTHEGWYGFDASWEGFCTYADEVDYFKNTIENPAGLGIKK